LRPKRAVAKLVAFSTYPDGREVAVGSVGEIEIAHQNVSSLVRTRAGVVEEQQKEAIAPALCSFEVGSRKDRIDLSLLQIIYCVWCAS
jgi:hypothetical protein